MPKKQKKSNTKTKSSYNIRKRTIEKKGKQIKGKCKKSRDKRKNSTKSVDKTGNTLNIGKIMRKYSSGLYVSPSAVKAMKDRIELFLENAMPEIVDIAKRNGCKTIKECEDLEHPEKSQAHITLYFGFTENSIEKKLIKKE